MTHFPKCKFFQKTCQWALFLSFMPIYIPNRKVRYYSISEILAIKEYWNLIGCEPFLAITWEPDFSQASSFCRMLMNHKNFHFTQIPDKTNDVIFSKSPKNHVFGPFLTIFGHFCLIGFFSKKSGSVTQNYIWTPNTKLNFSKNYWVNSDKTYGQTEGQTEGRMEG